MHLTELTGSTLTSTVSPRCSEPLETLNPLSGQESPRTIKPALGHIQSACAQRRVGFLLGSPGPARAGSIRLDAARPRAGESWQALFRAAKHRSSREDAPGCRLTISDCGLRCTRRPYVFEFEAHPWVRQHVNGLLENPYFGYLNQDVQHLKRGFSGLKVLLGHRRQGAPQ